MGERQSDLEARAARLGRHRARSIEKVEQPSGGSVYVVDDPVSTDALPIQVDVGDEVAASEEIEAAARALSECKATELQAHLKALALSLHVFLQADTQLAREIGDFRNPRSAGLYHPALEQVHARALQQASWALQAYVAAASALVDHSRRFRRRYAPEATPIGVEYDARVQQHFGGPEQRFIVQLRNYSLHCALPALGALPGEPVAAGWPTTLILRSEELLRWDNWASEVRTFLGEHAAGIDLDEAVTLYSARVLRFYRWLFRRVWNWYAEAKREHVRLRKAHHAAIERVAPGLIRNVRLLDRRTRGEVPRSYEKLTVAKPPGGKRARRRRR